MSDMATTIEAAPVRIRPITVSEFERMSEVGILGQKERVELLWGALIEMPPIGERHSQAVDDLVERFVLRFAGRAKHGSQRPVTIGPSTQFQPDLVLRTRFGSRTCCRRPKRSRNDNRVVTNRQCGGARVDE